MIGGDLFLNQLGTANHMQYDNENRCYYLTALVKQGWMTTSTGLC